MLATIEHLEPTHPDVPALRHFVRTWERKGASPRKGRNTGLLIVIGLIVNITIITAVLLANLSPARPTVTPTDTPYYSTQTDTPTDPSFTSPNTVYPNGSGFTVECRDGTSSHAGGKRGACSHHGGEIHP